jgi:hypothetical protein
MPETNMVTQGTYKLVMPIHYLSFSVIATADESKISGFLDLDGKKLAIWPRKGYTEDIYKKLLKLLNFRNAPRIIEYETEESLMQLLENKTIDGICTLCSHPNAFVSKITHKIKVILHNWTIDSKLNYYFPNVHLTTMDFSKYRLFSLKKIVNGSGLKLSLFADKNIPEEVVVSVLKIFGERNGQVKNSLLKFSHNIPLHAGAIKYFEGAGFFVNRFKENKACELLAGKHKCKEGSDIEETANIIYSRDFVFKDETSDMTENGVLPFLVETKNVRDALVLKEEKYGIRLKNNRPGSDRERLEVKGERILDNLNATLDTRWQCYGKTEHQTKEVCEKQKYTKEGIKLPKKVWDKPCVSNRECPFFKANTNYENSRGGCIQGYCEMPLGVERKGFTLYDSGAKPICHGCSVVNKPCCKKKEGMSSPDYVFVGDAPERLTGKKELDLRGILL